MGLNPFPLLSVSGVPLQRRLHVLRFLCHAFSVFLQSGGRLGIFVDLGDFREGGIFGRWGDFFQEEFGSEDEIVFFR